MGSRHTRRSRREGEHTSLSEHEESNSAVSEDTESENESDLVSVLAFLLRSGQARLVRATTEGGSGIHLIHGFSSSDSDDEDFEDDFPLHNGNAPSPPIDPNPSTLSIDKSLFKLDTLLSSGQGFDNNPAHKYNICSRLHMRESSVCRRPNFSQSDRAAAYANFIPNKMETKAQYLHKLFCGRFSSDGSVFLSACQVGGFVLVFKVISERVF